MTNKQNIHGFRKMAKWLKSKNVNSELENFQYVSGECYSEKLVSAKTQHRLEIIRNG